MPSSYICQNFKDHMKLLICTILFIVSATQAEIVHGKEGSSCRGSPPAAGFQCVNYNNEWLFRGDFVHNSDSGLTFSGKNAIEGNFTFITTNTNFVSFSYNSFLRCTGVADFGTETRWKILLTPSEGRSLWKQHDRNVSYIQAASIIYDTSKVFTAASDKCTSIGGQARTEHRNGTRPGQLDQVLIVEFTTFRTFVTCKIWWIIPLVIIIVAAITIISLHCYFKGRNRIAESNDYMPILYEHS